VGTFPASIDPAQLRRVGDLMQSYGLLPRSASVKALVKALVPETTR
jgi:hypothetical protein